MGISERIDLGKRERSSGRSLNRPSGGEEQERARAAMGTETECSHVVRAGGSWCGQEWARNECDATSVAQLLKTGW